MLLTYPQQKVDATRLPISHTIGYHDGRRLQTLTPEAFSEKFSIEYLPHLVADSSATLDFARRSFRKGLRRGFFHAQRRWLGRFYKHQIEQGEVAETYIKEIDHQVGFGLFAARDFGMYEYVGVYTGVLTRRGLLHLNANPYCFSYPTGTWSLRPLMIDAQDRGNELRFINHAEQANIEAIGVPSHGFVQVLMRTRHSIEKDEQLTFDYGAYFWRRHKGQKVHLSDLGEL